MALAPGRTTDPVTFRTNATIGAGTVPDFINEGAGFMNNGNVAVDTNAPVGNIYDACIRQSAAGAFYGTVTVAGTDLYVSGFRISNIGQLVYSQAQPVVSFNGGSPQDANQALAFV